MALMVGIFVLASTISCSAEAAPTPRTINLSPTSTTTPTQTIKPTFPPAITPIQRYIVQIQAVAVSIDESLSIIAILLEIEAYENAAWRRDVLSPFDDIARANNRARLIVPPTQLEEGHQSAISGFDLYVDAGALLTKVLAQAAQSNGLPDRNLMEEVAGLMELGAAKVAFAVSLMREASETDVRGTN
ncbi:MAG: hypothetical protein O7E55_02325 [Chloroflexi bacterium]|nr:hypothetical protein [Chloroflexota bacterium]